MLLRTFEGATLDEALGKVREAFGRDALIVSTDESRKGGPVRVTAARERHEPETPDVPLAADNGTPVADPIPVLRHGLADSGVDGDLATTLLAAAHGVQKPAAPAIALAAAFDSIYRFRPLSVAGGDGLLLSDKPRKIVLVGPPGAGKTVTAAKLAARAQMSAASVRTISIDTRKTAGAAHLEALAAHLSVDMTVAEDPETLAVLCADSRSELTVIDTFGVNPFDRSEMDDLARFVEASGAEPVLVLPAGVETLDARDIATAFAALGSRRAIVTRIDLTRRLGSLLGAFRAAGIAFSDVSVAPDILPAAAGGLRPLNPVALARLVLPDPRPEEETPIAPAAEPARTATPKAWIPAS